MGLISELGLAFKNTLYYLNVFWGGRKIVEGGFLGPGLRFGGIHMWDRCRISVRSLWDRSRGLKPLKKKCLGKIQKSSTDEFHYS